MARTVRLPSGLEAEIRRPSQAEWAVILEGDDFDRILTKLLLVAMTRPLLVWDRPPDAVGPGELHLSRLDPADSGFLVVAILREALAEVREVKLGGGIGS